MEDETIKKGNYRDYLKNRPVIVGPNNEGKLPPQALELEESVLGALMLDKEAFNDVVAILDADNFYKEAHILIFKAMWSLFKKGEPIDLLTVTQELREDGNLELVGGAYFITQLTTRLTSAANIEFHARIVKEKYIARQIIKISSDAIRNAYDDTTDAFELLNELEISLYKLTNNIESQNTSLVGDVFEEIIEDIVSFDPLTMTIGTDTGIPSLSAAIMGLKAPNLITIGALTSVGKTALALNIARAVAIDQKKGVVMYSYEMSKWELVLRLISDKYEIPSEKLNSKDKSVLDILMRNKVREAMAEGQLHIEDSGSLNVLGIRASAKRLKQKYNIEGIIIDYIQLIPPLPNKGNTREQDVGENSKALKRLCKELDIWCLDLSQVNRKAADRDGGEPRLADLRESGSIEQDSDMVWFLSRPALFGVQQFDDGVSTLGMAELIIAKFRGGKLKRLRFRFLESITRFQDENAGIIYLPPPEPPKQEISLNEDDEPIF